jgi:hypothetical protein
MTNVLYVCPDCGSRLFAPPGGTKLKCVRDPETFYEQIEASQGDEYNYVDESGKPASRVGQTPPNTTANDNLIQLREKYEAVTGHRADLRWKAPRLEEEIEAEQMTTVDNSDEIQLTEEE